VSGCEEPAVPGGLVTKAGIQWTCCLRHTFQPLYLQVEDGRLVERIPSWRAEWMRAS
jgi:hypothetical protein